MESLRLDEQGAACSRKAEKEPATALLTVEAGSFLLIAVLAPVAMKAE